MESISVTIEKEQLEWLEDKVRKGDFASISHGIRKCVSIVKTSEQRKRSRLHART